MSSVYQKIALEESTEISVRATSMQLTTSMTYKVIFPAQRDFSIKKQMIGNAIIDDRY